MTLNNVRRRWIFGFVSVVILSAILSGCHKDSDDIISGGSSSHSVVTLKGAAS